MFLLIDKPKGMTSHDVVDEVRKICSEKRVGHGGTLDPNATGLLIIGVGKESARRLVEIAKETKKTYEAEIFLGEERETDDSEGPRRQIEFKDTKILRTDIKKVLNEFVGEQEQVPPVYSAIKIKGKKAYELARKGKRVEMKPRKIVIDSIELISYRYPRLKIKCEVSSGTYVRALARDIGRKLGCGAYLKNLRRTRIGKYGVEDAVRLV